MASIPEDMSRVSIQDVHQIVDYTISSPLDNEVKAEAGELVSRLGAITSNHSHHAVLLAAITILLDEAKWWKLFLAKQS